MKLEITIPGNAVSKKNAKRILRNKAGGPFLAASSIYMKWKKDAIKLLKDLPEWTGGYPVNMTFYHYRKTLAKFDFGNVSEGVQDVLQELEIIEDDSMLHVYPVHGGWEKDADNPRVVVTIEKRIEK